MNIPEKRKWQRGADKCRVLSFFKSSIEENEKFPANTNLLFVDLKAADRAAAEHPIPGVL